MPDRPKLGELLVMTGAIDQTQLGAALAEQRRFGHPLGTTLVRMGFLDEEALIRTLARQLKLPINSREHGSKKRARALLLVCPASSGG
jgi:hypothetical protein